MATAGPSPVRSLEAIEVTATRMKEVETRIRRYDLEEKNHRKLGTSNGNIHTNASGILEQHVYRRPDPLERRRTGRRAGRLGLQGVQQ